MASLIRPRGLESVDEVEAFYDDSRAAAGAGGTAVLLLLEAGADPNLAAVDGSTPLHEAVRRMITGSVAALRRSVQTPARWTVMGVLRRSCLHTKT
jgi:hypothetical protein